MTHRDRMEKLKAIADLIRQRDLAKLSHAQAAKARTEELVRALDRSTVHAAPDTTTSAALSVEKYGLWATNRRILLNRQLASETVRSMSCREAAQQSFGRSEVLGKLLTRR